jgi:phage gp29-like protein
MNSIQPAFGFAEAARRLTEAGYDVTERWIREHIGAVPHTKVGRNVRFTDELLAEFLEQQTRRPATAAPRRLQPAGGARRSHRPQGDHTNHPTKADR